MMMIDFDEDGEDDDDHHHHGDVVILGEVCLSRAARPLARSYRLSRR